MDYASRGDFATGTRTVAGLGELSLAFCMAFMRSMRPEDRRLVAEGSYSSDR